MNTSCIIKTPRQKVAVLRQDYLSISNNNKAAAFLLNLFEYWHNIKLSQSAKAIIENDVAEKHGDERTQNEHLFQFHTSKDLYESFMGLFSEKAIKKGLDILEEKNYISIHKNPNPRYKFDSTKHFLLHPNVVNTALDDSSEAGWTNRRKGIDESSAIRPITTTINKTTTKVDTNNQIDTNEERPSPPPNPIIEDLISSGKIYRANEEPTAKTIQPSPKVDLKAQIIKKISRKKLAKNYLYCVDISVDDFLESFVGYCKDNDRTFNKNLNGLHELLEIHASILSKRPVEEPPTGDFEEFRKLYPGTKRGLDTEFANFKKKHKDWNTVLPTLKGILEKQIEVKRNIRANGGFVPEWKHLQTWINQRCWEEEMKEVENVSTNNSPDLDNYDLSPEMALVYQKYVTWVSGKFPLLFKSNCRIYSKEDFFDLVTDRTVTARKYRITDRKYKEIREQAHKDMEEKGYLRSKFKTVYDYTRELMKAEIEIHA